LLWGEGALGLAPITAWCFILRLNLTMNLRSQTFDVLENDRTSCSPDRQNSG
jgi:hypothetical protein